MRAFVSFVARRVLISAVLLFVLSVVTFLIYFAIPINPGTIITGIGRFSDPREAAEELERANKALGTDRPVVVQYADWISGAVRGDFGTAWLGASITPEGELVGTPVRDILVNAAKVTGSLAIGGAVVLLVLALPLGMLAASRPRGFLDRTVILISLVAISTHPIVVALLLRLLTADHWDIAPRFGYCPFFRSVPDPEHRSAVSELQLSQCGGPLDWAHHLALPWLSFALFLLAIYTRMIRARTLGVLREDYIRTARAKGAPEWRVMSRHALRNAVSPVVTMLAMDIGTALGVAIYLETVFRLPGLGRLALAALSGEVGYDLPMILGVVLFTGAAIIVLNLLADVVVSLLDPRVRESGRRRAVTRAVRLA